MNFNEPLASLLQFTMDRIGDGRVGGRGPGRVTVTVVTQMRQGVKGNKM